jgi:hypothetical protein
MEFTSSALMLRGSILWSYSHIEQCIKELVFQTSYCEDYKEISDKPPRQNSERLRHLKNVLEEDGPLLPYCSKIKSILKAYETGQTIRNRMAHAHMLTAGNWLKFVEIVPEGEHWVERTTPYYNGDLLNQAREAARLSQDWYELLAMLARDEVMPTTSEARAHIEG